MSAFDEMRVSSPGVGSIELRSLAALEVPSSSGTGRIELCVGDVTELPKEHSADVLVVSAFRDNYALTPSTVIAALHRKGISVRELAERKAVDLREAFSCWLSREIPAGIAGIPYRRIFCFEPDVRGATASESVGDIFRALAPFVAGEPHVSSVAMTLPATGSQGYPVTEILPPLLGAAIDWLKVGLPLRTIRVYAREETKLAAAQAIFRAKASELATYSQPSQRDATVPQYDAFISYAREDAEVAFRVGKALENAGVHVFLDQLELDTGAAWQQKIFEVMDEARAIIVVYSPDYLRSKVCQEEFNIAWARRRKSGRDLLYPIYWRSANLPTYMGLLNFADCREQFDDKLKQACTALTARLRQTGVALRGSAKPVP